VPESTSVPKESSEPVIPTTTPVSDTEDNTDETQPTMTNPSSPVTNESFPDSAEQDSGADVDGTDHFEDTSTFQMNGSESGVSSQSSKSSDSDNDDNDPAVMGIINDSGAGGGDGLGSLGIESSISPAKDKSWVFFFWLILLAVAVSVYNSINKRREKQEKESLTKIAIVFVGEQLEKLVHSITLLFLRIKSLIAPLVVPIIAKVMPSSSIAKALESKAAEELNPNVNNLQSEPENRYSQAQRLRPPKKIDMTTDN